MTRWLTLALLAATASAHDVPDNVAIQAFLKPEAGRMVAVVRIPVKALLDIEFPARGASNDLDLTQSDPYAEKATELWVANLLTIEENGARLPKATVRGFRISYDTDPSFASFASAAAHLEGPKLAEGALIDGGRATLDVLLDAPIKSEASDFVLVPRWGRLGIRVMVNVGFLPSRGGLRTFVYEGDPAPYDLDPQVASAAGHFVRLGLEQVTKHADYGLFLLCLVLAIPGIRAAAIFAAAFSGSLIFSAYGPSPSPLWTPLLAGSLMATAIVYMGFESIIGGKNPGRVWIAAAVSGLAFGAGSWFDLKPALQFGGAHPFASVLSFNSGLVIGELVALAVLIPGVKLYSRLAGTAKINQVILAGLAIHIALHQMFDRAAALRRLVDL